MVELVKAGRKPRELAIEFGCHETSITEWVRRYAGGTPSTVTATTNEREELIQLRRKVRQLEQERDILAKATAWFAGNGAQMSTASTR
jgi:transposase